ncbi:MAG: hypothetical protein LQ347_000753 [Umbilicaria vellea]|nr:MAG: hypothetical protein LQ347_000753 [Umbilicaria vellea]
MQLHQSLLVCALFTGAVQLVTAASWGFDDATISVQGKGAGVSGGSKEKLVENKALSRPIQLGASDTLKVLLTVQENKKPKRPHQAFLHITEPTTGLETSYALAMKENGKGKVELTHKDIPSQLLTSSTPLSVSLVIGSFGSSKAYNGPAFDLSIKSNSGVSSVSHEKPLRYGKLPEIHHIFRPDPTSPPKVISIFFTAAVIAALPSLFITWLSLGANLNHLSKAIGSSPLSHALFFGSILAMEGIFFMYYTSWNLFQTLPAAIAVGSVTFLSGSRALTEVQERRLSGLR